MTISFFLVVLLAASACSSKNTEGTSTTSETSQSKPEQSAPITVESNAPNDANIAVAASDAAANFSLESQRGRVGFDWFVAGTCQEVNSKVIAAFKRANAACEKETTPPFGVENLTNVIRCKVGKGEWLLFANADDCKVAYETMEANAP